MPLAPRAARHAQCASSSRVLPPSWSSMSRRPTRPGPLCRQVAMTDCGDHVMVLGQVERFSYSDEAPLLFHAGRFIATR